MNTNRRQRRPLSLLRRIAALPARFPRAFVAAAVAAVVLIAVWAFKPGGASGEAVLTAPVRRGPLLISVTESGTIRSRERVVLKSEVEGRTTILYIIPEGTYVEPGDLLVELDASGLEERKTSQEISVIKAEAAFIQAREDYEVTKSQGESDVSKAQLAYDFARQDLKKYIEGEYPKELQKAEADITLAKEEQQRAADELRWSERLAEDGFITETELTADRLAKKRADLNLKQAELAFQLLKEYTHPRQLAQLESDIEQTKMALERAERKAKADMVQAEANLRARESEYKQQQAQLEKILSQIEKSRIKAPVAGMVVYATTGRGGWRGNEEPLAEGQEVRERQELIYLPTANSMMAEIKVQESSLRKVSVGMHVRVTVDALPGTTLWGRVAKVGLLPDAQSVWLNPDLKVYSTEVHLGNSVEGLRPGMSCRAEIIVQQLDEALFIPVQSVIRVKGKPTVYVRKGRDILPQEIQVGYDNDRFIHVVAGLSEGQEVMLSPPLAAGTVTAAEEAVGDADMPEMPVAAAAPAASGESAGEETPGGETAGVDFEKLRSMTPEERRAFFENMSEEDREKLREQFGGRRRGEGAAAGGMRGGGGRGGRKGRAAEGFE